MPDQTAEKKPIILVVKNSRYAHPDQTKIIKQKVAEQFPEYEVIAATTQKEALALLSKENVVAVYLGGKIPVSDDPIDLCHDDVSPIRVAEKTRELKIPTVFSSSEPIMRGQLSDFRRLNVAMGSISIDQTIPIIARHGDEYSDADYSYINKQPTSEQALERGIFELKQALRTIEQQPTRGK